MICFPIVESTALECLVRCKVLTGVKGGSLVPVVAVAVGGPARVMAWVTSCTGASGGRPLGNPGMVLVVGGAGDRVAVAVAVGLVGRTVLVAVVSAIRVWSKVRGEAISGRPS